MADGAKKGDRPFCPLAPGCGVPAPRGLAPWDRMVSPRFFAQRRIALQSVYQQPISFLTMHAPLR